MKIYKYTFNGMLHCERPKKEGQNKAQAEAEMLRSLPKQFVVDHSSCTEYADTNSFGLSGKITRYIAADGLTDARAEAILDIDKVFGMKTLTAGYDIRETSIVNMVRLSSMDEVLREAAEELRCGARWKDVRTKLDYDHNPLHEAFQYVVWVDEQSLDSTLPSYKAGVEALVEDANA